MEGGSIILENLNDIDEEEEEEGEFDYEEEEGEFDEDEEEEEEEEGEDEGEEDEEKEKMKEGAKTKKKRCRRRLKLPQMCLDLEDLDEDELEKFYDIEEECEDLQNVESEGALTSSSVFSSISFEWENKTYEFEELCDPGIMKTIHEKYFVEPFYPDNIGQMRYLYLCRLLYVSPVLRFYLALESDIVDLSFRNFDGKNFRAMCSALAQNAFVENFILKYNRLTTDDCYYLGNMLSANETIVNLDMKGCRIGPEGVRKLAEHLIDNTVLQSFNLSRNQIQNEGARLLSEFLCNTESLQVLDLSYNSLEDEAAEIIGNILKTNKTLTALNLSYNKLFDVDAMKTFFKGLAANTTLTNLNLSWNGISGEENSKNLAKALQKNEFLESLDLSCNRFDGTCAAIILRGVAKCKNLKSLSLGKNPILPEDLDRLIHGIKACKNLELLNLEDLWANKSFMKELRAIQKERPLKVIIGGVLGTYEIVGPDFSAILLKRAQYEAQKAKKKKLRKDFGHFVWSLGRKPIPESEFREKLKKFKTKLHKDLVNQIIEEFTSSKTQLIEVLTMRNKYLSLFPDSQPPSGRTKSFEAGLEEEDLGPTDVRRRKSRVEEKKEMSVGSDFEDEEEWGGEEGEYEGEWGEEEENDWGDDEDEESDIFSLKQDFPIPPQETKPDKKKAIFVM